MSRNFPTANDEVSAIEQLQKLLLIVVEAYGNDNDNRQYQDLRTALVKSKDYRSEIPRIIRSNHDLSSIRDELKSHSQQWQPRRDFIREQMRGLFDRAEALDLESLPVAQAEHWTGSQSVKSKKQAIVAMLPVVNASLEELLDYLEQPGANGGPILDQRQDAINQLKHLREKLNEIIEMAEADQLSSAAADGLIGEASRYAKRMAKTLAADPMPYAMSALILSVLAAAGFPGIGGYLGAVALNITKTKRGA